MNFNSIFILLVLLFSVNNAFSASISITSSSLDLDNSELSISANLADFNHTSSDSHYVISFGIQNSNNAEQASGNSSPTTFNGSVISTPSPVCDIDQELLVKEAVLDTTNNTLDIVALVCNTSNDTQLSDWSVNAALGNVPTGESALDDQPLQNLVDSGGQPTPIAFDSFDQVKLALDDSNGSLNIEATVSDLAFDNGDDIQVTVNLANSDNNESAAGDATASASDSDNAAFNGPAGTCSNSGSELIIESVTISPDNGAKKIAIQAKACDFSHQTQVQNPQAWSVVLGLSSGSQSGAAQSAVLEFEFTSASLVAQLDQQIAAINSQIAGINSSINTYNNRIRSYNRRISKDKRDIKRSYSKIKKYKKNVRKLKRKMRKYRGKLRIFFRKKINRYNSNIRKQNRNIRNARKRISRERRNISNARRAINTLRSRINGLNSQKNQLVAQRAELIALRNEAAS